MAKSDLVKQREAKEKRKTEAARDAYVKQIEKQQIADRAKRSKDGPCFVATAAFGDYDAPEVVFLRTFRDDYLSRSVLGLYFIKAYYILSPPLAGLISRSKSLCSLTRNFFLQPIISMLRRILRQ